MKCPDPEGKIAKKKLLFGESALPQRSLALSRFQPALKSGRTGWRACSPALSLPQNHETLPRREVERRPVSPFSVVTALRTGLCRR